MHVALGREVVAPGNRDGGRDGGLVAECSLDEELTVSNLKFYKNDRQRKKINNLLKLTHRSRDQNSSSAQDSSCST